MIDSYSFLKLIHILSSTILFGFGAGTAFYMWTGHISRDPKIIAHIGKIVVRADWIFTGSSGVFQPLSGIALAGMAGYSLTASWLIITYILYALALACWIPVVWLQMRARDLAIKAMQDATPLPAEYDRVMRYWFLLGWPAFLALIGVYGLMVAKPSLW
ncbi:MAG: DUF2269 family protein [bacterium]